MVSLAVVCLLVDRAVRGSKSSTEGDELMYADEYYDVDGLDEDEEEEYSTMGFMVVTELPLSVGIRASRL